MRKLFFSLQLLFCACAASAADYGWLKPYEGRWFASAQTSFGPAAVELNLSLADRNKPVLDAKIKTNTAAFTGGAELSGEYLLNLHYVKNDGPSHVIQIPIALSTRDRGHELSSQISESSATYNAAIWLADKKSGGAYPLEITLPPGLRIAGIPLPLPPKLMGALKTTKYTAEAEVPVFPGMALELRASRDSKPDKLELSGTFALYSVTCQLRRAGTQKSSSDKN